MMPRSHASPEIDFALSRESSEKPVVLLFTSQAELTQRLVAEFSGGGFSFHLPIATTLEQARRRLSHLPEALAAGRVVIFFDDAGIPTGRTDSVLEELCSMATVVALLGTARTESALDNSVAEESSYFSPTRSRPLRRFLLAGQLDIVPRDCFSIALLTSLIERHALHARRNRETDLRTTFTPVPEDFGELFRHEVNNPLTGILGNAELILARRNQIPASIVGRLETIAELAIRLRETVRRLSEGWSARFTSDMSSSKRL